jgi:hypothetical protein
MKEAPLFVRGYDLYGWLLDRMESGTSYSVLRRTIVEEATRLIEAVTLALQGYDPPGRALHADEAAALLRLHLRMAEERNLLTEKQYAYAVQTLDDVGRQLGGWRKRLDR